MPGTTLHRPACRCAQCLGLLGAIDPSRVQPELPRPSPFKYDAQAFLTALVKDHLVRVLQTASDISQLEMTSYALQQILQNFTAKRLKQTAAVMLVGVVVERLERGGSKQNSGSCLTARQQCAGACL